MAFEFESRIRYSETDREEKLSLAALVDYFQDCTTFQSESCGMGIDALRERNRVWMLLSWQIDLLRYPRLYDKVRIQTMPYELKAFYGYRNFAALDEAGAYLVKANSVWVLLDTRTMKPCKVDPELVPGYAPEEKLDMEYLPRKLAVPEAGEEQERFPVLRYHLDANGHVNNGKYIQMAEEYLPEGLAVRRLQVEYRRQAHLHDWIVPVVYREEGGILVSLCDEGRRPYAVVAFRS